MSLYKRPNSQYWYCRFEVGGKRIRRSTGTSNRKEAAEFEDNLRKIAWRSIKLGEKEHYFEEAALRWLEERDDKKALHSDKTIIRWFRQHLAGVRLTEIDGDTIAALRKAKRSEKKRHGGKAVTRHTVNRHMAWLRSMLRAARDEWGWIDTFPKIPMYREIKPEPNWATKEQFWLLHGALPDWKARPALFAVNTGLRAAVIRQLEWTQIDFDSRVAIVRVSQSKNAKPLRVPLGDQAIAVLKECRGHHPTLVFVHDGKPLRRDQIDRAWRRACKVAGLENFRFHDLRHTWASWHVQNGTPLHVLQELGGWSSITMVQRYAHLAPTDLDKWARSLG